MDRPGHGLVPMVLRLHAGQPSPAFRTSLRKRISRAGYLLFQKDCHQYYRVNRLMIARRDHEQMKNTEGCIVEIIGENNLDHFFVGTQDTDMRKKFQERHARSEKLMKENRLKVILNSDGEIENMDEETHAERHARTVALAQNLTTGIESKGPRFPSPGFTLFLFNISVFVQRQMEDYVSNPFRRVSMRARKIAPKWEDRSFLLFYLCFVDLKKIFCKAAIARLEALENDYTRIETVEAVDDDEASLEDDGIRFQVKENVL
ncbi:hypothetical protein DKX38_024069 [Salix brachista]|uniref:Uncharacterized protein n=1 Tax=Salix brachista TaxID=2182728 RepID=A0A5N5JQQ3_9ROSI|nr:hypothetical protein DKX38_024069 [Salix brachista]